MELKLTPEEQETLTFDPGDSFEILPGIVSFTGFQQPTSQQSQGDDGYPNSIPKTHAKFFFESDEPNWGVQEWTTTIGSQIPNGPALLVLYKRGQRANPFGAISMLNRAWTHNYPLADNYYHRKSWGGRKLKGLSCLAMLCVFPLFFVYAILALINHASGGWGGYFFGALFLLNLVLVWKLVLTFNRKRSELDDAARALMFRLAKNAEQYWQGGGNSMPGKL